MLLTRSSRLSWTPLNPFSSSRRRFFSASFATVFGVVFADSRTRRRAKSNSYHQILPRLKIAIRYAANALPVRDIGRLVATAQSSEESPATRHRSFEPAAPVGNHFLYRVRKTRDIESGRSNTLYLLGCPECPELSRPVLQLAGIVALQNRAANAIHPWRPEFGKPRLDRQILTFANEKPALGQFLQYCPAGLPFADFVFESVEKDKVFGLIGLRVPPTEADPVPHNRPLIVALVRACEITDLLKPTRSVRRDKCADLPDTGFHIRGAGCAPPVEPARETSPRRFSGIAGSP